MSLLSPSWTWAWPSWLTELLSGIGCVLLGVVVAFLGWLLAPIEITPLVLVAIALGTAQLAAFIYELVFDAQGFSWTDIAQREIGILVGTTMVIMLWRVLR